MSHSKIALESLTPREAAVDALYRAVTGLDTKDRELFASSLLNSPEARFAMAGTVFVGVDKVMANVFDRVAHLTTHHNISNVRVDLKEGGASAHITAHALAYHFRAGEALDPSSQKLLSGSTYQVEVVKDDGDGLWKAKSWEMDVLWREGDRSVMQG